MSEEESRQGPEGLTTDVSGGEVGGNPTVSGLTAGGTGTEIGDGYPEVGGPHGSGGGVLKQGGNPSTVGGEEDSLGGTIVGAGIPAKPAEGRDPNEAGE